MKSLSPDNNHYLMSKHVEFLRDFLYIYNYGRHPVVFAIKQPTHMFSLTQRKVYFKQLICPVLYATCFVEYLGHRLAQGDTTQIQGSLALYYISCVCSLY
jgi:hypothetical protein